MNDHGIVGLAFFESDYVRLDEFAARAGMGRTGFIRSLLEGEMGGKPISPDKSNLSYRYEINMRVCDDLFAWVEVNYACSGFGNRSAWLRSLVDGFDFGDVDAQVLVRDNYIFKGQNRLNRITFRISDGGYGLLRSFGYPPSFLAWHMLECLRSKESGNGQKEAGSKEGIEGS